MSKQRYKLKDVFGGSAPQVATLPDSAPASPFLDPSVAQAEPQGSELYNLGTVQQAAASTQDAGIYEPSVVQEQQNYPTGAEGGATRPEGSSPLLYPSAAEAQPKLKRRLKVGEALALAEINRPKRKSPEQAMDELAVGMNDPSQQPLPMDLWEKATQRRSQMIKDGRLPMEFGEINGPVSGIVWGWNAGVDMASSIIGTVAGAGYSAITSPLETARKAPATIPAAIQRVSTEFGLQTYQDLYNLTHEPKYRVKETGEFVTVNKTGLPLVMPAASGGNNVISGDGIIDLRTPEQGIRKFAEQGKTLVPVNEQDLKEYRYGQYLDRMAVGAQSLEANNLQVPSNLAQRAMAAVPGMAPLAAILAATDEGGTVGPDQAQTELAILAAQSVIPMGAATRTWGVGRRVAGGLSKVAGAAEAATGFFPDLETALKAKFVKTVTKSTNLDAGAQKTALQAAIDGGKTIGIATGLGTAATGLSALDAVPDEAKKMAWAAAGLYSGYKGGMFVARRLRSASGFTKTVLKEVADPAQGLDMTARMRVATNPDVPDFVRNVLRNPSSFRAMESTPARLAKNQALSPVSRAVFGKLSDYRFVQAARLAKDTASGVPKGIVANVPFAAGAMASDDPERAGQMLAAGGVFGAMGGAAGRFTEARQRSVERAEGDIARMLVDIQAGNELGSGLGGDIMRNRIRPGTQFQDGPGGFVLNPDREVSAFLTEVEMAGGDVSAFVRGKSFDELAQWAAYQGFFRDKVDLVPLNATDYKLNAEAAGQNGSGAYFLQPSEGRRARIFVNAESRRNGLAPHEYGHAVLRGGALSPDQIDAVHAEINARYAPDALRNMAGEYAATMVRAENAKQGINIEPSPAAITAKVNELSQGSMIKGSADGLDWLREEIFAEEFRNANIDMNRARRNIPLGANPVSFFENLLGAQSRALHMAGIDIDPQTGKPMGRDQIFKENRVAAGDPVVMKNYEDYVKQWRRWINDPTHEADPGVPLSKTGNVRETADSPNVTWKDYGRGRMETEFAVKNPDGSVTPKDWNKEIKPTVRARQQAVREMSNRSKEVAAADDQTFGMRRRRDGRLETSGRRLPDSFFFIPQYKPFHDILRKINAADDIGETLQVRFFSKGKSKDVFKDGIKNTSAVNREALHGNFVAKKDGTLMWGWLDMTQFRNRAMKAIADKNPALAQYDWTLKAIMDDLPVHLTDQRRGKGGAFSVGKERANILNGLIGIGDGPLVGAFGKGTAYKTIHLDSIDAIVPTGKTGGEFDVYRANRNAMPDAPKPPVDMETDIDNNRMPQQIPREAQGMPDAVASGRGDGMPDAPRRYVPMEQFIKEAGDDLGEVLANAYNDMDINEDRNGLVGFVDTRNSMYRQRVPVKEFFDWLHSDEPMRGLVFADEYRPATAGEGATHTRESYQALLSRLRDISLRKPKPSAAPRGQAMPDVGPVLSAGDADTLPVVQKLNDKGKPAMKDGKPDAASIGYDLLRAPGIVDYVGNKAEDLTKPDYDGLDYDVGPQLRKEIDAAIDSGAVDSAANRTAEFAREQMQNPEIAAGKGWYSRMREKLLSAVGEQGRELLSQLLGATSAKTPVDQNFLQAMDAYEGILAGRYERHRQGYLEMKALESEGKLVPTILERGYVDVLRERANKLSRGAARLPRKADRTAAKSEANALRKLVNKAPEKWDPSEARAIMVEATGILPMRSNGKKFNANSRAVLKVIADDWKINRQAPKTPNFAGNLSGRTVQATIDVWAARHLRELLYKGSGKPWRIQPKSEVGVTNHDFALGQIIMQRAAKKLDMNPDDLQAILWFAEKHKWDAKGWTDNAGAEKSSFDTVANLFFPEGKKPLSFDEASKMYNDMKAAEKAAKKAQDKAVKAAAAKL